MFRESAYFMPLKCSCLHHGLWQVLSRARNKTGNYGKILWMFRGGMEFSDNFLYFSWLVHANCHCLLEKVPRKLFEAEAVKSFPDVHL